MHVHVGNPLPLEQQIFRLYLFIIVSVVFVIEINEHGLEYHYQVTIFFCKITDYVVVSLIEKRRILLA